MMPTEITQPPSHTPASAPNANDTITTDDVKDIVGFVLGDVTETSMGRLENTMRVINQRGPRARQALDQAMPYMEKVCLFISTANLQGEYADRLYATITRAVNTNPALLANLSLDTASTLNLLTRTIDLLDRVDALTTKPRKDSHDPA
jgi:hypothetical protein